MIPTLVPAPGAAAVLAVSGGLDSTVLARTLVPLLQRWGVSVWIGHADHQLRGEESDGDRAAVEALGNDLGVSVVVAELPADPEAVDAVGLEAALRASRRTFLRDLAGRVGAEHVYLAHHRDDQVESIVLRLQDGVPPERAVGMRVQDGIWCRPLLSRTRAELRTLALARGWSWREDSSNTDRARPRNQLRHVVLPALRAATPGFDQSVLLAAEQAAERRDRLDRDADRLAEAAVVAAEVGHARADAKALLEGDPEAALAVLQRLVDPGDLPRRPPSRAALQALLTSPKGRARRYDLGGGWTARLERGGLTLLRDAPLPSETRSPSARTWDEESLDWPGGWRLTSRRVSRDEAERLLRDPGVGRTFALFDPAALQGPLRVVSAPQAGRMRPFGGAGSASVRKLLMDAGVPRSRRGGHPAVLDCDGTVVWVPGIRAADHAPLDRASTEALLLYTDQSPAPSQGQEPSGRDAETS